MELNELWDAAKTQGATHLVTKAKRLIDEAVDEAMVKGADIEVVKAGREARAARKQFRLDWENNDLIEQLTSNKLRSTDMKKEGVAGLNAFLKPQNHEQLKRLKGRLALSSDSQARQTWKNIAALPMLEAFEKALKQSSRKMPNGR